MKTIEISVNIKNQNMSTRNLKNLSIHEKIQKLNLNDVMMDFVATSLYPSAMWDGNSAYAKTESGFAFSPHMNNLHLRAYNDQNFNEDGNESAV